MENLRPITNYKDFWPYYLAVHSKMATVLCHAVGTVSAFLFIGYCLYFGHFDWLWLAVIIGYGPAWFSHFFIEKNKPATFGYPLWSFFSDFRMIYFLVSGRLAEERAKYRT